MKLTETYLLAHHPDSIATEGWKETHAAIANSIERMVWPPGSSNFRIPRIQRYRTSARGKVQFRRNGVNPIKSMFRDLMRTETCLSEHKLHLSGYFKQLRESEENPWKPITRYPSLGGVSVGMNESVGDFDFYYEHSTGFKTVIEWESGNISSSHRSVNKMVMALWANLCDAAVLVLPSRQLYEHLTDRIGNITEMEPYFYYFQRVALLQAAGVLAVCVVEHDELFDSQHWGDFIPTGPDGNSMTRAKEPKNIEWLPPPKRRVAP